MTGESLAGVKAAFDEWRRRKRHLREAYPADLLERARVAARHHGPAAVARATKVDRARLRTEGRGGTKALATRDRPTFSRFELTAPVATHRPFAEVEVPSGLRVRLFTQTDEALALLASLFVPGGAP